MVIRLHSFWGSRADRVVIAIGLHHRGRARGRAGDFAGFRGDPAGVREKRRYDHAQMLYGRDLERARIGELLDGARSSRSAVLVISGEPGVGKSALLEDARDQADGMLVLSGAGVESETQLPFAALHQIVRPVLRHLEDIPRPAGRLPSAGRSAWRRGEARPLPRLARSVEPARRGRRTSAAPVPRRRCAVARRRDPRTRSSSSPGGSRQRASSCCSPPVRASFAASRRPGFRSSASAGSIRRRPGR